MARTKQTARKRKGTESNANVAATKVAKTTEKAAKTTEKPAKTKQKAPPSRYTRLPIQCGQTILEEIASFLKNRVTDKWLSFEKQKLMRKHPGNSQESIDELLLSSLTDNEKYNGRDLKQLISTLKDPTIIESTKVSSYISIGTTSISEYIKQGGSYHCILCGIADFKYDIVCQEPICNVPVFVITGLIDVLFQFTELGNEYDTHWGRIAFKKVKNNPFDELVKIIADKIPNEFSPSILQWKQSICVNNNSENGKEDVSSNVEVTESSKKEESFMVEDKKDLHEEPNEFSPPILQWKQSICVNNNSENGKEEVSSNVDVTESSKKEESFMVEDKKDLHEKEVTGTSDSLTLNFTQSLPQIQIVFKRRLPRWLQRKKKRLMRKNPEFSAEYIEYRIYKIMLFQEEFAGEDFLDMLSVVPREGTENYLAPGLNRIYQHVENGGLFHFILFCNSVTDFINENAELQSSVANIPLCSVKGLSTINHTYLQSPRNLCIFGFKKAKDNPFDDLVKFVADKIPLDIASLMAPLEESIDNVATSRDNEDVHEEVQSNTLVSPMEEGIDNVA